MSITIQQGSILDSEADFIVNPANSFLRHGAGLAALIAKAAAPKNLPGPSGDQREPSRCDELGRAWWDEQFRHASIPTGAVALTSSGHLPYKGIIHAVGPIWGGGNFCEAALLASAHAEALAVAEANDGASIAFPAISCGIFGYPVEKAAPIAISTCLGSRLHVEFWLFEQAHFDIYDAALTAAVAAATEAASGWDGDLVDDGIPRVDPADSALAALSTLEEALDA